MGTAVSEHQLGRYRIVELIGRGGMGEVYLAGAQGAVGFEKPVVLKVLRPKYSTNPDRTARLLREAMIGVRLDHEHLVQVLDLGEQDGKYFVAMEYVRGFNLGQLIAHAAAQKETTPLRSIVHVVRAICEALDYVHHADGEGGKPLGLIHRDISPSNILLGSDGRIKLSDFGIAELADEGDAGEYVAGKPPYLPLEAFHGGRPCQAWDVYALGVVLYEGLAACRAFEGDVQADVVAAIERGAAPLDDLRPDCPAALALLVHQAIHPDPARRFATAAALRDALDRAIPRRVEDADRSRAFVEATYTKPTFIDLNGTLPGTGDMISTQNLRPAALVKAAAGLDGTTSDVPTLPPLRFGLSPAHGASIARANGERLAARLKASLGRAVRPVVVADYRALVDCLVTGEVDFAWMPPAAYVEAEGRGAGAIVVSRRFGRTSYESAIIVRAESSIRELAELRGESMAWVDRESSGGYLFAVAEIVRHLGQPSEVFKRQHFLGSHHAVCDAVINGWAAAGATFVVRDDHGVIQHSGWSELMGPRAPLLRAIAFSQPIPGDNIAHRPDLHAAMVELLADTFSALGEDEDGRLLLHDVFNADGLVRPPVRGIYDEVRTALRIAQSAI